MIYSNINQIIRQFLNLLFKLQATTHQSLSEQIAGVLSKSSDAMEESTNEVNTMPLSFEGEATDRSSVHNPIPAPQAIPFLNSAHQNNHELSSLR